MPHSFSNTILHVIFGTKFRQNFIDDKIESKLFGYIGQVINNLKCTTIIVGGYKNHIHILCRLHRPISQSKLVKEIKANSSIWMKKQGEQYEDFYWQDGYATFSVSQSDMMRVVRYIQDQKQHHQHKEFETEYVEFLNSNKLEYDPRYIWD